ncbi:hypothetical protein HDU93_009673 [Gonapodya sp. JEL0774]|nr:hypothetical protein HDU93_009673 [Gonapodya sp. JEL0774]
MSAAKKQRVENPEAKNGEESLETDPKVEALLKAEQVVYDSLAKLEEEIAKLKTAHYNSLQPALDKRDAALKALNDPEFWQKAIMAHLPLRDMFGISPRDSDALEFLTGVTVKREKADYRNVTVTFKFKAGNPVFKNKELTKKISVGTDGVPKVDVHPTFEWIDDQNAKKGADGKATAGSKRKADEEESSDDDDDWSKETSVWGNLFDGEDTEFVQLIADEVYPSVAKYALIDGEDESEIDEMDEEVGDDDVDDE